MKIFGYREGLDNKGVIIKGSLEQPQILIYYADVILSAGVTISTVGVTGTSSTGASITATIVGAGTVSGTTLQQRLLTGGAGGTGAALDGDRMKVAAAATLSNGIVLNY